MNLHYSKTYGESHIMFFWVLLPYEFTLLQNSTSTYYTGANYFTTLRFCTSSNVQINIWSCYRHKMHAITLLQNLSQNQLWIINVLLPYEFTLLQNLKKVFKAATSAYITRLFNYILSYHVPFLEKTYWLPYLCKFVQLPCDFAPLQTLKETSEVATGTKCTQLHYSKTNVDNTIYHMRFYYPMNLHYSKTGDSAS